MRTDIVTVQANTLIGSVYLLSNAQSRIFTLHANASVKGLPYNNVSKKVRMYCHSTIVVLNDRFLISAPSKRVWKNLYRTTQVEFEKLSASGVFVVDATTLLHFCNLVTTYIIVLLQFAFL